MKLFQIGLACAAVLATGAAIQAQEPPSQADVLSELVKLSERLDRLEAAHAQEKEAYERTIAELRTELAALKGRAAESEAQPAEDELDDLIEALSTEESTGLGKPGPVESIGRAFQNFNPDISVIGDFVGHYSSNEGGDLDDEYLFREVELGLSAPIDPFSRADVFLGIHKHDGEWVIHVEEAYVTYLGMEWGLQPRVGRFKASFGKANPVHLHALPWVEYPLIVENYFGYEGLSGDGWGVSWLIPNPKDRYIELTYETFNNDSSLFAGEETDDFVHLLHLKQFFDLSESTTVEAGLSFATAPNDEGHGGNRTMVEGIDLTLKWRPPKEGRYKSLLWQTEFLAAQADLIGGQESTWGMYTAGDYQFARRWALGARYDYSQMPYSSSLHEHGYSTYLTFLQSEYLFWRLGYMFTDRNFQRHGDKNEHEVFLQCNFGLGPHRAHEY